MPVRIADRWFETRRIDDAITLVSEPHVIPLMRCNIWHVRGRDRDLLIDTGMGIASLREGGAASLREAGHRGRDAHPCRSYRRALRVRGLPRPSRRGRPAAHARQAAAALRAADYPPDEVAMLREAGYEVADESHHRPAACRLRDRRLPHPAGDADAARRGRQRRRYRRPQLRGPAPARSFARQHRPLGEGDRHPLLGRCDL